jgi:hypothetical protein
MEAVGSPPMAVDNSWQHRTQESPAKLHIMGGAGDAGGTLRGSSGEENTAAFSAVQPHLLEVIKAASNAFIAEEQALRDVGPTEMAQAFKNGSYAHRA